MVKLDFFCFCPKFHHITIYRHYRQPPTPTKRTLFLDFCLVLDFFKSNFNALTLNQFTNGYLHHTP